LKEFLRPTTGKILAFTVLACVFFITCILLLGVSVYRFSYFTISRIIPSTLGSLAESNSLNASEALNTIEGYQRDLILILSDFSEIEATLIPIYNFLSLSLPTSTFPILGAGGIHLSFFQIFLPLYWYILSCAIVWILSQLKRICEVFKRE
jgi:hypothetical protein